MMIGASEIEGVSAPAIELPAEPHFRDLRDRKLRFGRMRRGAIILAALFHAAVIAAFLVHWPFAAAPPAPPPPSIAVELVTQVPQPPKPPPKPAPPQPQHFYDLHSGPDQETTAPPQAETKGPEAAPKPQPPPVAAEATEPPQAKPAQPAPPVALKPKEAPRDTASNPAKQLATNIRLGDKAQEGDPYMNTLKERIEQHRSYPANAVGSYGLRLQGLVVYDVAILPTGVVAGMRLERSSGSPMLDETARKMIEQAAPFPPLPNYLPHEGVVVTWTVPVYPPSP
jgi:protein TonB